MKIEIEIEEDVIKDLVAEKIAQKAMEYFDAYDVDYDKRDRERRKRLDTILKKIDWKHAPQYVSETVIKKFFEDKLR